MLKWLQSIDWAPIFGSALLLVVTLWLITSFVQFPCEKSQQDRTECQHAEGDGRSAPLFSKPGTWIERNRDSIEVTSTSVIAIFTIILAGSTIGLWIVTRRGGERQLANMMKTERAYVKMSHHPPGIYLDETGAGHLVRLDVRNFGRTPAKVIDGRLVILPLKCDRHLTQQPDYTNDVLNGLSPAFVVTNDGFSFLQRVQINHEIMNGAVTLYLYGYVEYVDIFGNSFRAGYGRYYKPLLDDRRLYKTDEEYNARSNLAVISERGYNYDRPKEECGE